MQQTNLCTAQNRQGKDCMAQVPEGAPLSMCMKHIMIIGRFWDENKTQIAGSMWGSRNDGATFWEAEVGRKPVGHVKPRHDVVYYIIHGNRIKIGTSGNWKARISGLPHDRILALEPGHMTTEHIRHQQFAATRVNRTEWFEESEELWAHILELNDKHPEYEQAIIKHNRAKRKAERIDPVTGPVHYV